MNVHLKYQDKNPTEQWKDTQTTKDKNEKQVTLREGQLWEEEGKRRKLRRWLWLMYFLYKIEYRI
jgi:hypothetical protein